MVAAIGILLTLMGNPVGADDAGLQLTPQDLHIEMPADSLFGSLRNSVSVSEHFLGDRRLITCSERHLWSAETVLAMKSKCRSHFQAMLLPGAG